MCCHCHSSLSSFVPIPPTADHRDRGGRHMMMTIPPTADHRDRGGRHMMVPTACNHNVQHTDPAIKEGDKTCLLYNL